MADGGFDPSRRRLFRRRAREPVRPPWARTGAVSDGAFTDSCTRCDRCRVACPDAILVRGDGGFPEVDFQRGECSFCRACADACPEGLFAAADRPPWPTVKARIADTCLAHADVHCAICRDGCEPRAIRFDPVLRAAPRPRIDSDACTGCGACVASCPVGAIAVAHTEGGGTA